MRRFRRKREERVMKKGVKENRKKSEREESEGGH